jgi:hypothetical protein
MLVWRPFQHAPLKRKFAVRNQLRRCACWMTEVVGAAFLARVVHDDTFLSEIF